MVQQLGLFWSKLKLTGSVSDIPPAKDARIWTVGGSYTFAPSDNMVLAISGFAQETRSGSADVAASSANLSAGINWVPKTLPVSLSGNLEITRKELKHLLGGYSDPRIDDSAKLELALTHNEIQYYGFNPTFDIALTRNFSNMTRYDTETVQIFTRLSAAF